MHQAREQTTTTRSFALCSSTSMDSMTMILASSRRLFTKTPGSSSSMRKAACTKNLISESFEAWTAPPSSGIVGRFISVTQVGDAASVQLSFKGRSNEWLDFHNLLRINGVWKILEQDRHAQQPVVWAEANTSQRLIAPFRVPGAAPRVALRTRACSHADLHRRPGATDCRPSRCDT